ncbi:hypothetical protein Q8F55_006536 [Vanrija albida]|uniref:Mitochondrial inner membrane protease subunit n=1 Tax=Vanrija albida TaxID=181172 RepID=A0ABR3PYA6_9TREE
MSRAARLGDKVRGYGWDLRYRALPVCKYVVQAFAFVHLVTEVAVTAVPCSGTSMLPSLSVDGDVIVHAPLAYWRSLMPWGPRFVMPKHGELVVATNPNDFRGTVCKRVIGLPGDIVEYDPRRGDVTWSNGSLVPQLEADKRKEKGLTFVKVPKGHVWLSGDNLSNSTDSRDYGPMPIAMVRGKVLTILTDRGRKPVVTTVTELGPSPDPASLRDRKSRQ